MNIQIDQIITATKILLEIKTTSEHDADIRYFINQGAQQLFATNTRSLMCKTVDISCGRAEVDKDFLFFTLNGNHCSCQSESCACPVFYYFTPPAEFAYYKSSGYTFGYAGNRFTWNNGYLNLPSTVEAESLTYYFMGLSEDCEGYMILDAEHEYALSNYAAYRFISTANRIKLYPREARNIFWSTWIKQFNRLTSERFSREFRQNKDAIRSIMAKSLVYYKYNSPGGIAK